MACTGAPAAVSTASASAFASKASTSLIGRCLGEPAPHARRGGELILRRVAFEDLPDLEQRCVGKAAVGVALRGLHQTRDQARAHI
jgi:hypothetical protein